MTKSYNKYFVLPQEKKNQMCKEKCSICGGYNTDEKGNYKDLNARYMCCDKCQREIDDFIEKVRLFGSELPHPDTPFPILPQNVLFHSLLFMLSNNGYVLYTFLFNVLCKLLVLKTKWINEDVLWFKSPGDVSPEDARGFIEFALKTKLIAERKPSSSGKKRYALIVKRLYSDEFVCNLFPVVPNARFEKGSSVARMLWNDFAITYERIYNNPPKF